MFYIQLFVFSLMLFAGLAALLQRLIGKHATTATAHLQGLTQEYLKRQEELKKRLEEAEKQYQALLAKAQAEGQEMKAQALRESVEARRKMVDEARQEAERIVKQAVQAKDALRAELEQGVEKRVVEWACQLILEVLPQQLQESAHTRWLEEVISNGLLHMDRLETSERVQEARVVSAAPLTPPQKEKILAKLKASVGHAVTLKEDVDPRLIAGLVITIGHLVLDGSLASKLREAVRRAEHAER